MRRTNERAGRPHAKARPKILTLTTDFGLEGPYVAAMKGVVLSRVPEAQIVDVTHTIAPQHILEGAFVLAGLADTFPAGTVHLAVVDPGVGTDRRLVAVALEGHWFVLPDNGLISGAIQGRTPTGIWEITSPAIRRAKVSATFHGRDILAPAAAHLLRAGHPGDLGPRREQVCVLTDFMPKEEQGGFLGEVIFRDAFGNLLTNVRAERLGHAPPGEWTVEVAGHRIAGLSRTYGEQPPGRLVALVGSSGWVEVAVVNGDASRLLGVSHGATVRVRREARP